MIWLLIGYMFLFIHRPFEVWPVLGTFRIELIYMLFAGSVWLAYPHKRFPFNPIHFAIFAFAGAVLLCALASPWSDATMLTVEGYCKLLVFYVMVITTVRDERDLKRLAFGFLVVMSLYMLHSLWEFHNGRCMVRMGIRRMVGVDSSRGDPNSFATTILLAFVMVPAVWQAFQERWHRTYLIGFLALGVLCIVLTGSRGAFVGLLLWAGIAIYRSRWRKTLGFAVVLASPLMWAALPDSLQNRFWTIIDPSVGPSNAQLSAEARIIGFNLGMELWQEFPLTGVGPGAWRTATGRELQSHNLYGQLAGEMGTLGVMTFAGILLAMGWNVLQLRRMYRDSPYKQHDFCYQLAIASAIGVLLLLFAGNFGHNLYRYNWLWFGAFLSLAFWCARERLAQWSYYDWQQWDFPDEPGALEFYTTDPQAEMVPAHAREAA